MSQRRELAVPRKWTELASTECINWSRSRNGKNKYIKGEKWQKQVHQGREMAILNRSKQQLLSETYSQSDPPLTFLLFFSCLLFISPDSFNVLLGANMPTESEVQSRSHFVSTFIIHTTTTTKYILFHQIFNQWHCICNRLTHAS